MNAKRAFIMLGLALMLSGCSLLTPNTGPTPLTASGTITVDSIVVAPEIAGKILAINVADGDDVKAGDTLFTLDDQLLQAQKSQAQANLKAAQAGLDAANQKLSSAQAQYNMALQASQEQIQQQHTEAWKASPADKVTLPVWYFQKSEQITALQSQVTAVQQDLATEQANLDSELKSISNSDFIATEKRLAEAQAAYDTANQTLIEAKAAKDTADLQDAAQKVYDSASSELTAAQNSYNQMLSTDSASRVREARARVAVAQERLNITQDQLNQLQTGQDSLSVLAAQDAVNLANSGVAEAQAAVDQAQAALDMVNTQLSKTVITAPTSGVVLSKPANAGETTLAGQTIVEIGNLDQATLSVYIPEDKYGNVHLGQQANVTVDSFPGRTFAGKVTFISDQAEFTPRNVQTTESRSATVYKVEITLSNQGHELKPGMPADATFE